MRRWPLCKAKAALRSHIGIRHATRHRCGGASLRETITAAVEAHGQGKILDSEMPISQDTRHDAIRYAPSFSAEMPPAPAAGARPTSAHRYTVEALAKFLGMEKSENQRPKDSFVTAFGAVELIHEGYLTESADSLNRNRLAPLYFWRAEANNTARCLSVVPNAPRALCTSAWFPAPAQWTIYRDLFNGVIFVGHR